jgi:flavin-dependent dehydrogenase
VTERDAIIIGGGPAGAVAAWRLASVGWDVLLVERRDNGADKCCGLCLHPEAVELADAMGCGDAIRMASLGVTTRGRVLVEGDRVVVDDRFERGGLIISRRVLDAILRTAAAVAGADVRTETSARIDSIDSGCATVTLTGSGIADRGTSGAAPDRGRWLRKRRRPFRWARR